MVIIVCCSLLVAATHAEFTTLVTPLVLSEAAKGLPDNGMTCAMARDGSRVTVCISKYGNVHSFDDVRLGDVLRLKVFAEGLQEDDIIGRARGSFRRNSGTISKLGRVLKAVISGDKMRRSWTTQGFAVRVEAWHSGYEVLVRDLERSRNGWAVFEVTRGFEVIRILPGY